MAKSATELAEGLVDKVASLTEEIERAAIAETRKFVSAAVEGQFLQPTRRRTYDGKTPDECIVEMLREAPLNEIPRLQQALERFESGEVSEDFRAGILFAVRLFADKDYEY